MSAEPVKASGKMWGLSRSGWLGTGVAGLVLVLAFGLWAATARAVEPLVADLSKHLVAITTGFAGTDVLLFGAIDQGDEANGDVVVVVRGPNQAEIIRRKERLGGIYINQASAKIPNAPSFYQVASSRPLTEVATPTILRRHQIGLDQLDIDVRSEDKHSDRAAYRQALMRLKIEQGLYGASVQEIGFLGNRLFRADMHFPSNVPVGTYLVEVYYLVKGMVISAQTTPLVISKIGFGADLFDFAHQHSFLYGLISVVLAAVAGWAAAFVFRR